MAVTSCVVVDGYLFFISVQFYTTVKEFTLRNWCKQCLSKFELALSSFDGKIEQIGCKQL